MARRTPPPRLLVNRGSKPVKSSVPVNLSALTPSKKEHKPHTRLPIIRPVSRNLYVEIQPTEPTPPVIESIAETKVQTVEPKKELPRFLVARRNDRQRQQAVVLAIPQQPIPVITSDIDISSLISILLPIKGEERFEQARTIAEHFRRESPKCEIIVIEQDKSSHGQPEWADKYIFCYSDRNFNRSWAFNVGVRNCSKPYALLHDCDLIPSTDYLKKTIAMLEKADVVWPWYKIKYMDQRGNVKSFKKSSEVHGGSLGVRVEWYKAVGGMQEDCWGWGAEDDIFYDLARRLGRTQKATKFEGATLMHMWHQRTSYTREEWVENVKLMNEMRRGSVTQLRRLNGDWNSKGIPDFLVKTDKESRMSGIPENPWLHIIYDAEGWAYYRRASALAKYAPSNWKVTIGKSLPSGKPDIVFLLTYGQTDNIAKHLAKRKHGLLVVGFNVGAGRRANLIDGLLQRADLVVFNNLEAWELAGKRDDTISISNGVDLDIFRPRQPLSGRKNRCLAVVSEYHAKLKGWDSILQPLRARLHGRGIECDFRKVKSSRPPMNHEQMAAWYSTGKIYVVASESEGTPNPALEAAGCGCVVVSSRVGNMPELIVDGKNGKLVDERTVDSYVAAITEAIDQYSVLSGQLGKDIQEWNWKKRASMYFEKFEEMLGINTKPVESVY